jgi:hypothetical protein
MVKKRCRCCRELFEVKPQAANAKYCRKTECQQERQRRKYLRWIAQPENAVAHQEALKAWAKDYPDYWRHNRKTHPDYVRMDNERRAESLRKARALRKATGWRQIAVERLAAVEAMGSDDCSAKQTGSSRRVDAIVGYLRWTVEGPMFRKATGWAWVGGTAG